MLVMAGRGSQGRDEPFFLFRGLEVNSGTCGGGAEDSTIVEMDV